MKKCIYAAAAAFVVLTGCSPAPVRVPPIEELFPKPPSAAFRAAAEQSVDVHLDGTLSMQGFARPRDGRFAQFLQDLDLALTSNHTAARIRYYRFGSVIEEVRQRPFYVAAAQEGFFQSGKDYAATRIDTVFQKSSPGNLTIVLTDLFENNLDIASIQDSLRSASFPERSSLAIWQWEMPFSGSIYDFNLRSAQGQNYTGSRPLYLLALGPEDSLNRLRHALTTASTTGPGQFLLISAKMASNAQNWLTVTQTQHAGLVTSAPEYAVYRPSSGCRTAGLSLAAQLAPTADNVVRSFTPHPGSYEAQLFSVTGANGKWSTSLIASPQIQVANASALSVQVDCVAIAAAPVHLLRIRRMGTADDISLPDWIGRSNANSMAFNAALRRHEPAWGDKTLNLTPMVRGLASTAVEGTPVASAYFYFVKK